MPKIALPLFAWIIICTVVSAHQVLLTCWQDGSELVATVAFSDGSAARAAKVAVFSEDGDELFSGETDAAGECRVPVTEAMRALDGELRIVANAGMGHRAERRVAAPGFVTPPASPKTNGPYQPPNEDIVQAFHQLLHQELAPIKQDIAALKNRGPGITEILGGIGYIVGIAGLASFVLRRKERRE